MNPYDYFAQKPVSRCALAEWTFESYLNCETKVLPDGCRDFILKEGDECDSSWFVSELSHSSYVVQTSGGEKIRGIRLQPGVDIRQAQLDSWLQANQASALFGSDQIDEFCIKSDSLTEALACLASRKSTISCVAKELGVSHRSLQRLVRSGTGQTPFFWFSLARARRAGRCLLEFNSISDTALETGFSDQAHMNREMKKWFRRTPKQIRTDEEMMSGLLESGYG